MVCIQGWRLVVGCAGWLAMYVEQELEVGSCVVATYAYMGGLRRWRFDAFP